MAICELILWYGIITYIKGPGYYALSFAVKGFTKISTWHWMALLSRSRSSKNYGLITEIVNTAVNSKTPYELALENLAQEYAIRFAELLIQRTIDWFKLQMFLQGLRRSRIIITATILIGSKTQQVVCHLILRRKKYPTIKPQRSKIINFNSWMR